MPEKTSLVNLRWQITLVFSVGVLALAFTISSAARSNASSGAEQDINRLDSRMTQLEQRLYTIESSLRNLEQQSRINSLPSRSVRSEDLDRLNSGLQALERRLADDECGLARIDERTLSPEARNARRKSGVSDQCRSNLNTPLRLP